MCVCVRFLKRRSRFVFFLRSRGLYVCELNARVEFFSRMIRITSCDGFFRIFNFMSVSVKEWEFSRFSRLFFPPAPIYRFLPSFVGNRS